LERVIKAGVILAFLCCWFSSLFCAVDVYVFNVGQGNCIWVSMDVISGRNAGKKKVLIVDCGLGNGKAAWIKQEDFIVKLKRIGLFEQVCDYALWVTHLHADHFSLLEQNIPPFQMPIYERVGYVFAGVGGGVMGEMGRNFEYWPVSELPPQAKIIRKMAEIDLKLVNTTGKNAQELGTKRDKLAGTFDEDKYQEEERKKRGTLLGQTCACLQKDIGARCFPIKVWDYTQREKQNLQRALDEFTAETDCRLRPLLPELQPEALASENKHRYNEGKEPTNPNDQSLVLALEYAGKRVIFPGDAPGDLFLSLNREDRACVSGADVLIAPHHGSVNNKENLWETYDVSSRIRKRYCTIVSSIPVAKDFIPNKEFMSGRPSRAAFVAAEPHPVLVYDQVGNRNRHWRTSQTKFSMDKNVCYYRCHIGGDLQLRANERVIGIGSREEILEIDRWESDWED
jgi:hypothetical protein